MYIFIWIFIFQKNGFSRKQSGNTVTRKLACGNDWKCSLKRPLPIDQGYLFKNGDDVVSGILTKLVLFWFADRIAWSEAEISWKFFNNHTNRLQNVLEIFFKCLQSKPRGAYGKSHSEIKVHDYRKRQLKLWVINKNIFWSETSFAWFSGEWNGNITLAISHSYSALSTGNRAYKVWARANKTNIGLN